MHHIKLLVVRDGCTVRVIDEEGTVKHDVSKYGYSARMAVLQDDSILIAWKKDGLLTIDLYTPQLGHVRTVLSKFKLEGINYCLAEFSTGEIAFTDENNLYVFQSPENPLYWLFRYFWATRYANFFSARDNANTPCAHALGLGKKKIAAPYEMYANVHYECTTYTMA